MVPDFRRDDVWTPVFTEVTVSATFCEIIISKLFRRVGVPADRSGRRGRLPYVKTEKSFLVSIQCFEDGQELGPEESVIPA
jgi:hypothetical protein